MKPFASFLVPSFIVLIMAPGLAAVERADSVEVGGRTLRMPPPSGGFVRCDGFNKTLDDATQALLPENHRFLASFGSLEDQAAIRAGGTFLDTNSAFSVQTFVPLETTEIDEKTFLHISGQLKKSFESMHARLEEAVKNHVSAGNQKLPSEFGIDAAFNISDLVMLGIFEDTGHSLGFATAMKLDVESGEVREVSRFVTAAIMTPVNGRLVTLHSSVPYKSKANQLEAETTVKAWRDMIVAANPRVQGPAAGFDWTSVGRSAGIGGGVGLIFGLVQWLKKRSCRSTPA